MWVFLKYYLTYYKSENLSKLLFMPVGIIIYELNQAVNFYSELDEFFTISITFSFLMGTSVNEFKGRIIRHSAFVPVKRKEIFAIKILYVLIPAFIYSIFLQLYFLIFKDVGDDYFHLFFIAKFYVTFILLFSTINDLFKSKLKLKYLWLFIVPLIVLLVNVVGLYVFIYYFEQFNTGFFIILEVVFLLLLIPNLLLLYYFFTKRTDFIK